MLQKLQNHINTNLPILNGKKLLLAVSGGIDSMVLVDLFAKLDFEIAVAHCNFQLRSTESEDDEEFVKRQSSNYKLQSFIRKFETEKFAKEKKLSIQQTARDLRYDWFDEMLTSEGFDYVLTAHHLDDSVETFLINFSRGTGLEGLTGIPQQNGKIVRPLLIFSRLEIENYAKENNIQWREDSSNASEKYVRNKIRHQIIPVLKELNPTFLDSFQNTILHLKENQNFIENTTEEILEKLVTKKGNGFHLSIPELEKQTNKNFLLYQWLKKYGFTAWNDIYDLTEAQSGKQIFSASHLLLKNRDFLILTEKSNLSLQAESRSEIYHINENETFIELPIKLSFCNQSYISPETKSTIFVDKEKLKFPLTIRKWHEGDYFYPSGMDGKKKVSKYFKDEKFSLLEKQNIWLLCSENEIVWIINHRPDKRYIANKNTQHILKIENTNEKNT